MSGSKVIALATPRCSQCPVRSEGICCGLSKPEFDEISRLGRYRHFNAGSQIIHQDNASEFFAVIVSGRIKLIREGPDGRQQIVGFLSESDCLGDLFQDVSHQSAECIMAVLLCCFPRKPFEAFLKNHPELEHRLFLRAMKQLDETREWLFALGQQKAAERVASFLLWLCRDHGIGSPDGRKPGYNSVVDCPFSRQDIADFLGLTIETVSRSFSKLRMSGLIKLHPDKRIQILDFDALDRLAETAA